MRIALVGSFPLEPTNFGGGVETSTWNLIEGLATYDDVEIHLITCTSAVPQDLRIERNGVTYHYLRSFDHMQTMTLYMRDRLHVRRKLSEIDPDVVHAQNSQNYGYICLKSGYPTVISVHGIVQEEARFLDKRRDRLRAVLRSRFIQHHCVQNAHHIVQPTRYPESYFGYLNTGKWHDTGNAISAKFFDAVAATHPGAILYSGAVIPRKRLLDLVKALHQIKERVPTVSLRVAGGMPDKAYLEAVRSWIDEHGLQSNVTFLGPLSQGQMVEEYEKCALLALPSGQETSPMVIAEAMAVGQPAVATRVGGVPFLIDDGETGFVVDVGDVDSLADRIATILTDDELRRKMGRQAKDKASRNYRRDIVAARVRAVYSEAISSYRKTQRNNVPVPA